METQGTLVPSREANQQILKSSTAFKAWCLFQSLPACPSIAGDGDHILAGQLTVGCSVWPVARWPHTHEKPIRALDRAISPVWDLERSQPPTILDPCFQKVTIFFVLEAAVTIQLARDSPA